MKKHGLHIIAAALLFGSLCGCAAGGASRVSQSEPPAVVNGSNSGVVTDTAEDIASDAGRTAVDAAKNNISQEVRRGVDEMFRGLFNR